MTMSQTEAMLDYHPTIFSLKYDHFVWIIIVFHLEQKHYHHNAHIASTISTTEDNNMDTLKLDSQYNSI